MKLIHICAATLIFFATVAPILILGAPMALPSTGLNLKDQNACRLPDPLSSARQGKCGPVQGTDLQVKESVETSSGSSAKIVDSDYQFNLKPNTHVVVSFLSNTEAHYKLVQGTLDYDAPEFDLRGVSASSVIVSGRKATVKKGRASVTPLGRGFEVWTDASKIYVKVDPDATDQSQQVRLDGFNKDGTAITEIAKCGETKSVYY